MPVKADGKPIREITLVDNGGGITTPTIVTTGSVSFFVHKYGEHYGIRIKDSQNPAIRGFGGCIWYPVNPYYRLRGQYVPHPEAQHVPITTSRNTLTEYKSPGVLKFEIRRQTLQLLVTGRTGNKLSLILRDLTAGKGTCAAVRFLTVEIDNQNIADIDFNRTYNPPCAFTEFATCPLPPPEHVVPVAIEAGERYEGPAH